MADGRSLPTPLSDHPSGECVAKIVNARPGPGASGDKISRQGAEGAMDRAVTEGAATPPQE